MQRLQELPLVRRLLICGPLLVIGVIGLIYGEPQTLSGYISVAYWIPAVMFSLIVLTPEREEDEEMLSDDMEEGGFGES